MKFINDKEINNDNNDNNKNNKNNSCGCWRYREKWLLLKLKWLRHAGNDCSAKNTANYKHNTATRSGLLPRWDTIAWK